MKEKKRRIISAGYKAVDELIKIAEEEIIKPNPEDDLAADRLKNAAATKKLAIFDAFAILDKIEEENNKIDSTVNIDNKITTNQGFAERRSK
jgi:hypothetical protein|tara:strand:+ start:8822 stop:9097 length:276 start_codon:yes stop_codon:yes gene_type:complete